MTHESDIERLTEDYVLESRHFGSETLWRFAPADKPETRRIDPIGLLLVWAMVLGLGFLMWRAL